MTDIPQELATALKQADLSRFFAGCTEAHRREYLKWIAEAKRPDTRRQRIAKAVEMIRDRAAKEHARVKQSGAREA
jgi:uncharacterized protein YdeI (YjbR/CyaY-like superfamily)